MFDYRGYPVFDDVAAFETRLPTSQFRAANYVQQMEFGSQELWRAIQSGQIPATRFTSVQLRQIETGSSKIDGYTWHHHQDLGRMQLVPEAIHRNTGHVGGQAMSQGR